MDLFDENFLKNYEDEMAGSGAGTVSHLIPVAVMFLLVLSYLVPVN
jgi:hypothetical protein